MKNDKEQVAGKLCGGLPQLAAVVVTTKEKPIIRGFPVVTLDMVCGNCGANVNNEDDFCRKCGARFRERYDI